MKHLKRFDEGFITTVALTMGAIALYDLFKANAKQGQLSTSSSYDDKTKFFDELSKITSEYERKNQLVGDIIDNDNLSQIIFKYGGNDNIITIQAYWETNKLKINWHFDTAIFPYFKTGALEDIEFTMDDNDRRIVKDIITQMQKV